MTHLFDYRPTEEGWRWITVLGVLSFIALAGGVLGRIVVRVLARVVRQTKIEWDDALLEHVAGPLRAACVLAVARATTPALELDARVAALLGDGILIGAVVVLFWLLFRIVDVGRSALSQRTWARDNPSSRSLLSIGARTIKVILIALAVLTVLAALGVPITSLVAGFGIGGLAVALAAQKTIENLFGTYSIGLDQPFREGDFVRVGDLVGTIEAIGLRSTRLRTLDRTTVLIPNGALSDARTESFTARDRIRLACTVGVVYETTAAQLRHILADMEALLRGHALIWPDAVVVRFKELAAYSLDIEVMAWFQTQDWSEFQRIRQEILLGFMEIVERNGSSFAFPSRTVYIARNSGIAEAATVTPNLMTSTSPRQAPLPP